MKQRSFAGMFALGLWDRRNRVLHLVRDRLGKKPLYIALVDGALLFASELKAMRFEEIKKRSDAPPSAAGVVLDEKHYDRLLEEAYETRLKKRVRELRKEAPEPADGEPELDEDAWVKSQMQQRLIASLAVGERQLTALAAKRADAIVARLVEGAQLPAERVFVVEPRADAPAESGAVLVELALAPA